MMAKLSFWQVSNRFLLVVNICWLGFRLVLNSHFIVGLKNNFDRLIFFCLSLVKNTFLLIDIYWFNERIIYYFFEEVALSLKYHVTQAHPHFISAFIEELHVDEKSKGVLPNLYDFIGIRSLKSERSLAEILLFKVFEDQINFIGVVTSDIEEVDERRSLELYGEDEEIFNVAHHPFLRCVGIGNVCESTLIGHFFDTLNRVWQFNQAFRHRTGQTFRLFVGLCEYMQINMYILHKYQNYFKIYPTSTLPFLSLQLIVLINHNFKRSISLFSYFYLYLSSNLVNS